MPLPFFFVPKGNHISAQGKRSAALGCRTTKSRSPERTKQLPSRITAKDVTHSAHNTEHDRPSTFQDELRVSLKRHGIELDGRYVWRRPDCFALAGLLCEIKPYPGRRFAATPLRCALG